MRQGLRGVRREPDSAPFHSDYYFLRKLALPGSGVADAHVAFVASSERNISLIL